MFHHCTAPGTNRACSSSEPLSERLPPDMTRERTLPVMSGGTMTPPDLHWVNSTCPKLQIGEEGNLQYWFTHAGSSTEFPALN